MLRIPILLDDPAFTYAINIDGSSYRLTFTYNERTNDWHLDIAEENGTAILSGIRLVTDWRLLGRSRDQRLPPGMLLCLSLDPNDNSAPRLEDLGRRVRLVYYDEEDLANIDTAEIPPVPGSFEDIFGPAGPLVT
jgi:hypothetical protein